ncbi:MAG: tetratricopeptide repeat protein [Acidobacteria bacterium]|nr:tetratricopeptide repeat protein [Acidobacteriota bacterium]
MLKTRDSRTWIPVALLTLPLIMVGSACSPEPTETAREKPREEFARLAGADPTTYGIDEVMETDATLALAAMDESQTPGSPALEVPVERRGFLLPELGLAAGDGRDHMAEGESLYSQGRHLEAAAHLQVAVEEKPAAWYRSYLLGLALWKASDLEGAADSLRRAAGMRPEFVRTKINLARVLNERELYGEALAAADRAVVIDPDNPLAHYLRGRSLANLGRVQDATAALRTALDLDPDNGDVWNRLGLLLLRHGEVHEAVTVLETAVSLNPGPAYIQNNLGLAYERSGRLDEAAQQFATGLAAGGDPARLEINLARVQALLGGAGVGGDEEDSVATELAVLTP